MDNRFEHMVLDDLTSDEEVSLVRLARTLLRERLPERRFVTAERIACEFVVDRIGDEEREVFGAMFLTSRCRLIQAEELFFGTVDRVTVHNRILVQRALALNAGAIILYHNHPSGEAAPSQGDVDMTAKLRKLFDDIDIRLLDHVVVAGHEAVSMATAGLYKPAP